MFKANRFRKKIALFLILFSLLPVTILGVKSYYNLYNQRKVDFLEEHYKGMSGIVSVLEENFKEKISVLEGLARSVTFYIDYGQEIDNEIFEEYTNISSTFTCIEYIEKEDFDHSPYESNSAGLSETGLKISKPVVMEENNEVILMLVPVFVKEEMVGYLQGTVNFSDVFGVFSNVGDDHKWIIEVDGQIIYNTSPFDSVAEVFDSIEEGIIHSIVVDGEPYHGVMSSVEGAGINLYLFHNNKFLAKLDVLFYEFLLILILILVLVGATTYYFSMKINYPFVKLKVAAEEIIEGKIETRIEIKERDELAQLFQLFNEMADKNDQKYNELLSNAFIMMQKNEMMDDLNTQLESSYNQLKAIIEMLDYSKNKHTALLENIKDFIWVMDTQGNIIYVNQMAEEKLLYNKNELLDSNILDLITSFEYDMYFPKEDLIKEFTKKDFGNVNLWLRAKNDEQIIVSANIKRIFKEGKLTGAQGIARFIEIEELLHSKIIRKNEELETFKKITWSLANSRDLNTLLTEIVNKMDELFSSSICTIRLLEEDMLMLVARSGEYGSLGRQSAYSINEDIAGKSILENRVIRITDFDDYEFVDRTAMQSLLDLSEEIIFIPLIYNNMALGTINLGFKRRVNDSDIKLMKAFANQSSLAINKERLNYELKEEYLNTIRVLATAIEAKDKYTEGHSIRVAQFAKLIGRYMDLSVDELEELEIAGTLHDIGKIGIYDGILTKNGKLSSEEYGNVKLHPEIGMRILEPIGLSDRIIEGVYLHHKRFDLKGYPVDVEIDELPLTSAIIGVADALDAMTSQRSYSKGKDLNEAIDEIIKYSGDQFSPVVTEALKKIVREDLDELTKIIGVE